MTDSTIVNKVKREVERLLQGKLAKGFVYHNIAHTESVVTYCKQFSSHYKITPPEKEILTIAAWFHDVGYTTAYTNHEAHSEKIARDFLQKHQYPAEKIEQVANCIRATIVDASPNNLLDQIIKDADLSNLGEDSFHDHSKRLRIEWFTFLKEEYTDLEWLIINRDFLKKHRYFTSIAKEQLVEKKKDNLNQVRKALKKERDKNRVRKA